MKVLIAILCLAAMAASTVSGCGRPEAPAPAPAPLRVAGEVHDLKAGHPNGPVVSVSPNRDLFMGPFEIDLSLYFKPGADPKLVQDLLRVNGNPFSGAQWNVEDKGPVLKIRIDRQGSGPWVFSLPNIQFGNRARVGLTFTVRRGVFVRSVLKVMGKQVDGQAQGLQPKPTEMLLVFKDPVDRASVEEAIRSLSPVPIHFEWESPQEAKITVPKPPDRLRINWTGAKDARGMYLWTPGYLLVFDGGGQSKLPSLVRTC